MTTIVLWKVLEFEKELGTPAIWVISDSRATSSNGNQINLLTDRCAKLVQVAVRVGGKNFRSEDTVVIAVAGNTLVAHNCIFFAQEALGHLVGEKRPSLNEIAEFLGLAAENITRDVGSIYGQKACCELILIGREDTECSAISISPIISGQVQYVAKEILEYPYVTGADRKLFIDEYNKLSALQNDSQSSKDQTPLLLYDKLFFSNAQSKVTGGEMQIMAVGTKTIERRIPMRWRESSCNYEFYMYGVNTFGMKIGTCSIGIWPAHLEDVA